MNSFFGAVDKYFGLVVTVAIIAVIVSQRSTTSQVIQSAASALSNILGAIVAPIANGTAAAASSAKPQTADPTAPNGGVTAPNGTTTPQDKSEAWGGLEPYGFF